MPGALLGRLPATVLTALAVLAVGSLAVAQFPQPRGPVRPPIVRDLPPDLMLFRTALKALAEGKLDRADETAAGIGADTALGLAIRGRVAVEKGETERALELFRQSAAVDATGEGALELGLLEIALGRRPQGTAALTPIVGAATSFEFPLEMARAARAARALGNFRQANSLFRSAASLAPDDPAIQTAWGDLFLEKYNRPEAVRSYQAAIQADAAWAPAHLGLARAMAPDNPPKAAATARHALTLNPQLEDAHVLLAAIALDAGRREEARTEIDRALALDARDLDARSLKAAAAWLDGRTAEFDAEVRLVLAVNPRFGEIYRVVGDHVARAYRFDEAAKLVQQGLALEADNSRAHASLGAHLLRTGDENGARASLDRAFRADPYDVVTYNLLSLLDTLDKFETFTEGTLTLKLDPAEAPVMRHYAMPLAQQALKELSAKYAFEPKGPLLIEIFPKHDDFAVRTIGLPGMIGALGACFGRVVAMDSPKARPPGFFSWRATLWHELAHVITLQLSEQRLPRWLSEGISTYEERNADESWGRESELAFLSALQHERAIPLADLNASFSDPERISLAYFQASLLVEHIVEKFGAPKLRELVAAYSTSLDPETPVKPSLGMSLAELQPSFDAFLDARYAALQTAMTEPDGMEGRLAKATPDAIAAFADEHPRNFTVQFSAGKALAEAKAYEQADRVLSRAVTLMPLPSGLVGPHLILAEVAEAKGDVERAKQELEHVVRLDSTAITAARRLAELATTSNDQARTRLAAQRIIDVDPFDPLPHALLGRLALQANDYETALREFRVAIDAGPSDRAAAHTDLAEAYLKTGQLADAKRSAMAALEIAPRFERAQEVLLSVVERK